MPGTRHSSHRAGASAQVNNGGRLWSLCSQRKGPGAGQGLVYIGADGEASWQSQAAEGKSGKYLLRCSWIPQAQQSDQCNADLHACRQRKFVQKHGLLWVITSSLCCLSIDCVTSSIERHVTLAFRFSNPFNAHSMICLLHCQQPCSQRCRAAVTPMHVQPLPSLSHFTPSRAPRSLLMCRAAEMSSATYNEQMKAAMGWEKADPFEYHYERHAVLGASMLQ